MKTLLLSLLLMGSAYGQTTMEWMVLSLKDNPKDSLYLAAQGDPAGVMVHELGHVLGVKAACGIMKRIDQTTPLLCLLALDPKAKAPLKNFMDYTDDAIIMHPLKKNFRRVSAGNDLVQRVLVNNENITLKLDGTSMATPAVKAIQRLVKRHPKLLKSQVKLDERKRPLSLSFKVK